MFSSRFVLLLALTLAALGAVSSSASAQEEVVIGFIVSADSLLQAAGEQELSTYVQSRAPLVGAAVGTLLEIGFEVGMQGDRASDDENLQFALILARLHAEAGESTGPQAYAERYQGWSEEDRAEKLRAQGLEARSVEARGEGDYELALAKLAEAAVIYGEIGDTRALAVLWGSRGVVHFYRSDFGAMENAYGRALPLRREIDDWILQGKTLNGMGTVHFMTARYPEAIDWYSQAVEMRRSTGDTGGLVSSLTYVGNCHWALSQLAEAVESFREAESVLHGLGENADAQRADLLNSQATVLDEMGDREGAILAIRQAVAINERIGENGKAASNRCNLAAWINYQGRHREAMEQLVVAEKLLESGATADEAFNFYKTRYEVYLYLGDFEASRDDLLEARKLATEYEMSVEIIEISIALSRLYLELGATDRALALALESVDAADQAGVDRLEGRAWILAGNASMVLGDGDSALAQFQKGTAIDRETGATSSELRSRFGEANALALMERYEEAREIYLMLLEGFEESGQDLERARVWLNLAHTYEREDSGKALEYYGHALAATEEMRREASGLAATTFFVSEAGYLFQEITRYYAGLHATEPDRGWANEAFLVAESAKSRGLLDRMDEGQTELASLATVQAALPADGLLLQYALGDSASLLWAIDRNGVDLIELPPKEQLRSQVEALRAALTQPGAGDERLLEGSRALYETLLSPVQDRLDAAESLLIVPDGALYLLPFELLLTEDPEEGQGFSEYAYLGRRFVTSYAPSSSVWLRLHSDVEHPHISTLLALGNPDFSTLKGTPLDPLPHSEEEVERIGARVDADSRDLLLGAAASETALRRTVHERNPLVLHLATHGLVDPAEPELSCVALTADEENDGFLYSAEIEALQPAASLVVLSACESATGRLRRGEGVVGLGRSFLAAGSHGIVASLWAVSDESTAVLMDAFYENLFEEKGAAESLNLARRALLEDERYAHPFHWAAFVVVGDAAAPWIGP